MSTKILASLFLLILLPILILAQPLIPFPKKLQPAAGEFILKARIPVSLLNISDFNNYLLLQTLEDTGIIPSSINIKTKQSTGFNIEKAVSLEAFQKILRKNKLDANWKPGSEGYVLKVSPENIQLFALTDAGIFYGLQTLKQLFQSDSHERNIPCMTIFDKPDFAIRAWQDDISRGPIPTMEMLKQEIKTMASFKLNYFTLYTEHVFKLDSHPDIAPADGITKEQIAELSAFAKDYQVTLIGNYQSFGHMEKSLNKPGYSHLMESGHILSPALDESYDFLKEVYAEVVPAYPGTYFNINCDETFGLGEETSKAMVDSIGMEGVYASHINKVNGLLKKYDKKILMWGDIAASYPAIVPALPDHITVIVWAYHPAECFDYTILPIVNEGLDFWVAPGVSCWSNVYPDLKSAGINIYNLLRDGYRLNAKGVLNTSWDDDGLNFFDDCWHGFAWGAENSWNAPPDLDKTASEKDRIQRYESFNKAFDAQFFGLNGQDESITAIIRQFSSLHQSGIRDILKNSRFFEPIFPIYADYIQPGEKEKNTTALLLLDSLAGRLNTLIPLVKHNEATLDYLLYAINRTQFTLQKNLFRITLNEYLNNGSTTSEKTLKQQKSSLLEELTTLKRQYIALWNKENRPHWLDINEKQFDKLLQSLNSLDGYVLFEPSDRTDFRGREVRMRSVFNEYPIYYAINDDTVTDVSPIYQAPIFIAEDANILARSMNVGMDFPVQQINLIYHKGIGSLEKLTSKPSNYHPSYDGGGENALLDGRVADPDNLWSGLWQGFSAQDIVIELDLRNRGPLHSFSMGFFQNTDIWVIFPRQVEIYTKQALSDDYELFTTIHGSIPPEAKGSLKENYTALLQGIQPAYVKVVARYYGRLPAWHPAGSGYESMIFSDEIIIK